MQLFVSDNLSIKGENLIIKNAPDLVLQLRKVLRAKEWYIFFVQSPQMLYRYQVALQRWTDTEVVTSLLERIPYPISISQTAMLVALPNKQEKLELIVQKLTEIWIRKIFLWASERSVLKTLTPQKLERLYKISKEALEQSYGWFLPQIECVSTILPLMGEYAPVIFDLCSDSGSFSTSIVWDSFLPKLGIVGPEWGLTLKDYQQFGEKYELISLGDSVLRMETAAIIGAWYLHGGMKL